jgi:cellulose synthase/poly-beta-1,6-N-acetylglucosamine synthase-like glycosyltransferase
MHLDVESPEDLKKGGRLCILLAAYIPNETETLPRTFQQFLPIEEGGKGISLPPDTSILLTYNPSPTLEEKQALDDCAKLAKQIPGVTFASILVPDSHTKAHNVNAGFAYLAQLPPSKRPDVVCVMDADIDVEKEDTVVSGFERLQRADPSTAVISVCTKVSVGSWLVAAEYAMKDIIMTQGYGSFISTGWLTGNFVFLRSHIAFEYGFSEKCLVEDNDLMFRLLGDGYFVDHRMDLAVYTEAPPRLMSFLTQRARWGQGATSLSFTRIPELVTKGSFNGMIALRRMFLKIRLLVYAFFVRLLPKYIIPCLLPTTLVLSWRCGQNPEACEHFSSKLDFVGHCGLLYMIIGFTAQIVGASFKHPWLRFYHYLAFVILRIPYGIFNAQAPVIADAQYWLKLDKWIVTERHVSAPPTSTSSPKGKNFGSSNMSTSSSTADLTSPLLDTSESSGWSTPSKEISEEGDEGEVLGAECGAVVAGAFGTYIRTH